MTEPNSRSNQPLVGPTIRFVEEKTYALAATEEILNRRTLPVFATMVLATMGAWQYRQALYLTLAWYVALRVVGR